MVFHSIQLGKMSLSCLALKFWNKSPVEIRLSPSDVTIIEIEIKITHSLPVVHRYFTDLCCMISENQNRIDVELFAKSIEI